VNRQAEIMPLKFLGPNGGYTSDAIEALNYAVANGAKVSNNSYGGGSYNQSFIEALTNADAREHLFAAAASNEGTNNDTNPVYPASYNIPNVVSVAATDRNDNLASFSNYGSKSVHLAAPGVSIWSTLPGNTYAYYSGTSMATPHVAGAASLVKGYKPSLDDNMIKDRLIRSADKKPGLAGKMVAEGRLNVDGEMDDPPAPDPGPTSLTLTSSSSELTYGESTILSGRLTVSEIGVPEKRVVLESRPAGATDFSTAQTLATSADGSFSANLKPDKNTEYRVKFAGDQVAGDQAGYGESTSSPVQVGVRVTVSLSTQTTNLRLGKTRTISGTVSPAHTGNVKLEIKRDGVPVETRSLSLTTDSKYSYVFKPTSIGTYSFTASFADHDDHLGNTSPTKSFKVVK
jgi:hypothetical protein